MSHASKKSRIERTYEFLRVAEEQRSVSLNDLVAATGYTVGTARTYITGKWSRFLILAATGNCYSVKGVQDQTLQDFAMFLQKRAPPLPPQRLVLSLPDALSEWLYKQAIQQERSIEDIILEVLEQHRQAH